MVGVNPEELPRIDNGYREWHGEWEDAQGDIVTYSIRGEAAQLRGYADYIPRDIVEDGLRKLGLR